MDWLIDSSCQSNWIVSITFWHTLLTGLKLWYFQRAITLINVYGLCFKVDQFINLSCLVSWAILMSISKKIFVEYYVDKFKLSKFRKGHNAEKKRQISFKIKPVNILIRPSKPTKFHVPNLNIFREFSLRTLNCPIFQRVITRTKSTELFNRIRLKVNQVVDNF